MAIRPYMRICNDRKLESAWHDLPFGAAFSEWSGMYDERTCVVDGERRTTYRTAWQRSRRLAAHFLKIGARKGDVVLFRLGNSDNFVFTLFALYEIGLVPVMLRAANRQQEIAQIARQTAPTLFITMDDYLGEDSHAMAREVRDLCPSIKEVIFEHELPGLFDDPANDLSSMHYERPAADDVALIMLSGGTTGMPKLVPHTHFSYLFQATCMADRGGDNPDDNCLIVLPASHNYTLLSDLFPTLVSGGTLVMCKDPSPADICHLIAKERITHFSLVPTLARLCITYRQAYDEDDISSLRYISEGGSEVTRDLAQDTMETFGCPFQNAYGMVEGYASTSYIEDPADIILDNLTTTVIAGDEVKIIDENERELPPNTLGNFAFRGPCRFNGYLGKGLSDREAFTEDGFYKTGDLAYLDEYGRLSIRGRVKDQINRAGESIMPEAIETSIRRSSAVEDCAVIGAPDDELGQRIVAFARARDRRPSRAELNEELRALGVSEHHLPDDLIYIDELPETPTKKVDKKELLKIACGESMGKRS